VPFGAEIRGCGNPSNLNRIMPAEGLGWVGPSATISVSHRAGGNVSDKPHHHAPFWVDAAANCLEAVRRERPHVHVLTSPVAQVYTANLLLAAGAEPSLSQAPGEIEAFAERTHGFVINLGMLDAARREAAGRALPILRRRGVPWVLDPVKVERSPERHAYARQLLAEGPCVVRANAAEMPALGDDLHADVVHATTGERVRIVHGKRWVEILNGDALMTRVTATGCAATTLIAAFLDALHRLDRDALQAKARIA
jgi:hydroxyethylthiazole kinase